jgi:hypothetical protein
MKNRPWVRDTQISATARLNVQKCTWHILKHHQTSKSPRELGLKVPDSCWVARLEFQSTCRLAFPFSWRRQGRSVLRWSDFWNS